MIRDCLPAESARVARIHADCLPGEFLSLLGEKFLAALYDGLSRHPDSFICVAEENGEVIGFVCGAVNSGKVSRDVMRRKCVALAFWAACRVLSRPGLVSRLWETMRRRTRNDAYTSEAEMLAIAVRPGRQRKGVGQMLVQEFNDRMRRRGVAFYHVGTTEAQPQAISFYERLGFERLEKFTVPGAVIYRYGCRLGKT